MPPPPEAWLSGPIDGVPALLMPVAHALVQARDDARVAAAAISSDTLWNRADSAAAPGFHLFHAAGALDRLFTYARGETLTDAQRQHLAREREGGDASFSAAELVHLFDDVIERALGQLRSTTPDSVLESRRVGRSGAPSNVLGLLFHAGEHTTRHVGQFITTGKIATARHPPLAIRTPRLDLVPSPLAAIRAARAGRRELAASIGAVVPDTWPHEYLDDGALEFMEHRLAEHPDELGWWTFFVMLREPSPTLIGTAGYKGPPSDGAVEIGYGIVSDHHRRGYASEAAGALVDAAFRNPSVSRVLAETLPALAGSIGVLKKCGFRFVGDGSESGVIRFEITRQEYEAARTAPGVVNLAAAFSRFDELWSPRIVGELNGQQVKLAKVLGEFVWHHHEHEDEMFYVVRGRLEMHLRDRVVGIGPGEFFIVPRGVEHKPVAPEETHILLFEPATTLNTGNVRNERTRPDLERL